MFGSGGYSVRTARAERPRRRRFNWLVQVVLVATMFATALPMTAGSVGAQESGAGPEWVEHEPVEIDAPGWVPDVAAGDPQNDPPPGTAPRAGQDDIDPVDHLPARDDVVLGYDSTFADADGELESVSAAATITVGGQSAAAPGEPGDAAAAAADAAPPSYPSVPNDDAVDDDRPGRRNGRTGDGNQRGVGRNGSPPQRGWDLGSIAAMEPLVSIELQDLPPVGLVIPGQRRGVSADRSFDQAVDSSSRGQGQVRRIEKVRFEELAGEGVSVVVDAFTSGAKLTYEFPTRKSVRSAEYEAVQLPDGWTAEQNAGAIDLIDADGVVRLAWTGGPIWDSADDPQFAEATLELLVTEPGVAAVARMKVDPSWLNSRDRVFPVSLDPQLGLAAVVAVPQALHPSRAIVGQDVVLQAGAVPAAGLDSYEWRVMKSDGAENCDRPGPSFWISRGNGLNVQTIPKSEFNGSGSYLWCVRAKTTSGYSAWSAKWMTLVDPKVVSQLGDNPLHAMVDSVNVATGNWTLKRTDVALASVAEGLAVTRTYNSRNQHAGALGMGWTFPLDVSLSHSGTSVLIEAPDGALSLFNQSGSRWVASGTDTVITRNGSGWTMTTPDGAKTEFHSDGRLNAFVDVSNNRLEARYTSGNSLPSSVVDIATGRKIEFQVTRFGTGGLPDRERITQARVVHPIDSAKPQLTWTYKYDVRGQRLESVCDARGATYCERYGWSPTIQGMTSVWNHAGKEMYRANYDSVTAGRVQTLTRYPATGRSEVTRFSGAASMRSASSVTVTTPLGHAWRYEFDADGRLTKKDAPDQTGDGLDATSRGITSYEYDGNGNRSKVTTPHNLSSSKTATFDYNADGTIRKETNGIGESTWYRYDSKNRRTRICPHASGGNLESPHCVRQTWNSYGELATRVEYFTPSLPGRGVVEQWQYNTRGQLTRHIDQDNRTTSYSYYERNETYGRRGDLKYITHPSGLQEYYRYNKHGQLRYRNERESTTAPWTLMTSRTFFDWGAMKVDRGPKTYNAVTGAEHRQVMTYAYDVNGRVKETSEFDTIAMSARRVNTYTYDRLGREIESLGPAYVTESGATWRPRITRRFDANGNVTQVCDARGVCTTTEYNRRDLPFRTKVDGLQTSYTQYWDSGLVRQTSDAEGRGTYFNYDAAERLYMTRIRAAYKPWEVAERLTFEPGTEWVTRRYSGGTFNPTTQTMEGLFSQTDYEYTAHGLEKKRTEWVNFNEDPIVTATEHWNSGHVRSETTSQGIFRTKTSYGYDAGGFLDKTTVDDGGLSLTTTVELDPRGNPTATTDPMGRRTTIETDVLGRVTKVRAPGVLTYANHSTTGSTKYPEVLTGFDAFGNATRVKDQYGATTVTDYDFHDRVTNITHPRYYPIDGSTSLTPTERFIYDANGNLVKSWDRYGVWTTYAFDNFNRVITETRQGALSGAPNVVARTGYDKVGNVKTATDASGAVSTYTYNHRNQVLTETINPRTVRMLDGDLINDPARTTTHVYDVAGNLYSTKSPLGHLTRYDYDRRGRRVSVTDPARQKTSYTYNALNLVTRVDQPGGFATINTYDDAGRLTKQVEKGAGGPDLSNVVMTHDKNGNVLTTTTAEGRVTQSIYDSHNRIRQSRITSVTPVISTTYGYDIAGALALYRDGEGRRTTYSSNVWGQREETREMPTTAHRNLTDRRFRVVYDTAGQVKKTLEPGATVSYSYDRHGQLRSQTAAGVWREFEYDVVGRTTRVRANNAAERKFTYNDVSELTQSWTPFEANSRTEFRYDRSGRLSSRATDTIGTHRFTWTSQNELNTHADPVSGVTSTYSWNDASQVTRITTPNGFERRFDYHTNGRLMRDSVRENGTSRGQEYFAYDKDGNIVLNSKYQYGEKRRRYRYDYDGANRLTNFHEEWKTSSGSWPGYSGAQNKTSYTYDRSGNRLTEKLNGSTKAWSYDERNRIKTGPEGTYRWDARGTLASIIKSGQTESYDFDAFGQMTVRRNTGDPNIVYKYDGLGRLANRDAGGNGVFKYAGFDMDPTQDSTTTYGRSASGTLTSLKDPSGDRRIAGLNRHGDLKWLTNSAGRPTETITFDPFGEVLHQWGADEDPNVGFQGDWTDPISGDVNMGARWYDSSSATFRSRDVFNGRLDEPISLNRYTYAANNPLRYWDPTGFDYEFAGNHELERLVDSTQSRNRSTRVAARQELGNRLENGTAGERAILNTPGVLPQDTAGNAALPQDWSVGAHNPNNWPDLSLWPMFLFDAHFHASGAVEAAVVHQAADSAQLSPIVEPPIQTIQNEPVVNSAALTPEPEPVPVPPVPTGPAFEPTGCWDSAACAADATFRGLVFDYRCGGVGACGLEAALLFSPCKAFIKILCKKVGKFTVRPQDR